MKSNCIIPLLAIGLCLAACKSNNNSSDKKNFESEYPKGSFGYALAVLRTNDSVVVLNTKDWNSRIIVSPKYQAKVFTSTDSGANGKSFGWINYKTFSQTSLDAHM